MRPPSVANLGAVRPSSFPPPALPTDLSLSAEPATPGERARSRHAVTMGRLVVGLPGKLVGKRYRMGNMLGRGSTGVVIEAVDLEAPPHGDAHVALKLL